MKIKKVSTEQFAGIRGKEVGFDDGINLVYGKNESGKGTLVNLISRTLFQDSKISKKTDKEFVSRYFPGEIKGIDAKGSYIQGKIVLDTPEGEYIITKEWLNPEKKSDRQPVCKLITPYLTISDREDVNSELKKALRYGEGVYSEMLLSSQYNTDISLKSILGTSQNNAKDEITDVLTKAFSESDGISAEKIAEEIENKIKIFEENWNTEQNIPKKKSGAGRWTIYDSDKKDDKKRVLRAYYDLEDARNELDRVKKLEEAVQDFLRKSKQAKNKEEKAKADYENFNKYYGVLSEQENIKLLLKAEEDKMKTLSSAKKDWPKLIEDLQKADKLKRELDNRFILDKFEEAKPKNAEIKNLQDQLENSLCPSGEEIRRAEEAGRTVLNEKTKLRGMNLSAAIKMFGGNSVSVKSLVTGKNIEFSEENICITEAVAITVPGVMEMQLAPKDINVPETEAKIERAEKTLSEILEKYNAKDIPALKNLEETYRNNKTKAEKLESELSYILAGESFEELAKKAENIKEPIRQKSNIETDVAKLCGNYEISDFMAVTKSGIERYSEKYGVPKNLDEKISACQEETNKLKEKAKAAENIPEEYRATENPEAHRIRLYQNWEDARNEKDSLGENKAKSELEAYRKNNPKDPETVLEEAERKFYEQKELLAHWLHIKEVFEKVRENFRNNPMHDLSESFTKYLGIISGERISSEFPDEEKLDMNIYSGNSKLDYEKLSEGTKETVSLAFRLAVLDHLFPDGGGVIVFDDPFTDMDAERTAKSCELIKECAKKHQVIFLTCNEAYKEIFSGKIIDI